MPNTSRISRSFAPGNCHQLCSKARIRLSSSDSPAIRPPTPQVYKSIVGSSMRHGSGVVRSPFVASFDSLTFITDYGLEDGFVAACHGVAARIAPGARIIDI